MRSDDLITWKPTGKSTREGSSATGGFQFNLVVGYCASSRHAAAAATRLHPFSLLALAILLHPCCTLWPSPAAHVNPLSRTTTTMTTSLLVYPSIWASPLHAFELSELKARTVRPLSFTPLLFVRLSIQLCMSNSDTCRCIIAFSPCHDEKAREPISIWGLTFERDFSDFDWIIRPFW